MYFIVLVILPTRIFLLLEPRPPLLKDRGTLGRPIKLQSNYFPITVKNPSIKLVHYDVTIKEGDREVQLPKKKKMYV